MMTLKSVDLRPDVAFESFELWNTLHHHNVARLIGRSSVGLKPVLVLEHLPLTLDEWLLGSVGAGSPSNAQVAQIVLGIASALSYMHALNVMHRNVRPACVYLDANLCAPSQTAMLPI